MNRTALLAAVILTSMIVVSPQLGHAGGRCRGGFCAPVVISSCDVYRCGIPTIPCGGEVIPGPNGGDIIPGPNGNIIPGPNGEIIPGPNGGTVIPGPDGGTVIPGPDGMGMRTWVYGASPKLVFGTYRGVEAGNVKLERTSGELVELPIDQLSVTDKRLVVRQVANQERVWTDATDQYTRRAKFTRTERDLVVLTSDSGKQITIPFARLSAADRVVVQLLSPKVINAVSPVPGTSQVAQR